MWVGGVSGLKKLLFITGMITGFCFLAFISYLLTLQFGSGAKKTSASYELQETKTGQPEKSVSQNGSTWLAEYDGDPVLNLIYGYNEKKQSITALILEIWNQEKGTLSYLTIPTDTGYTMSKELYQRLAAIQPEVPQMLRLSFLYQYFEEDASFAYGCAIISELLDTEIQDYTVFPTKTLKEHFKKNKKGIWKLQKTLQEELLLWEEKPWSEREEYLEEYITKQYSSMNTSRTLQQRITYLPHYKPLTCDTITYRKLPGTPKNAGYQTSPILIRQELGELLK